MSHTISTSGHFVKEIVKRFTYNMKREGHNDSPEALLAFLIERNIIPPRNWTKFVVVNLYPEAYYNEGNKTQAVYSIANELDICEKTVWTYLKNQNEFLPK